MSRLLSNQDNYCSCKYSRTRETFSLISDLEKGDMSNDQ